MARKLSPLNDFNRLVLIEEVNSSGVVVPVTTGTVTGFLATTNASDAADPTAPTNTFTATLSHVGGANDLDSGTWLFQLDAAVLTKSLLDTHFGTSGVAYLIVSKASGFRRWERLEYVTQLQAEIE